MKNCNCEPFQTCEFCIGHFTSENTNRQKLTVSGYDKNGNLCTEELELNGATPIKTSKILFPSKNMKLEKPGPKKKEEHKDKKSFNPQYRKA